MYKVLDDTKVSNNIFEDYIYKDDKINFLYKIFLEDIAEARGTVSIRPDRDGNAIVNFRSNNSFNNAFYTNIMYMISSSNNLVRIESLEAFNKDKITQEFFEKSYIDILLKDIESFVVTSKDDKYIFLIKQKDKERIIFSTYKLEK